MARVNRFRRQVGPKVSEGMRQTWLALRARGWGFADLSAAIGRERGAVNRWLWGDRLPDLVGAAAIEALLEIPARLWALKPRGAIERALPPLTPSARAGAGRGRKSGDTHPGV